MEEKIDRFGKCPNCGFNWDAGNIYEQLASLSCNIGKTEGEIKKLAENYGWTEVNKIHFTKTIAIETKDGKTFIKCPEMRCQHVFNRETGVEYKSIFEAKRSENAPVIEAIDLSLSEEMKNYIELQTKARDEFMSSLGIPKDKE